jgi:hypothetical protein
MNIFAGIFEKNGSAKARATKSSAPDARQNSTLRDAMREASAPLSLTPEMIVAPRIPASGAEKISYESIAGVIMRVRSNEYIGKGKFTKDEYLADSIFSQLRYHDPETRITYELIEKAISFVKRNPLMGAGKWTKEEHLAEYLYATVRLSNTEKTANPTVANTEPTTTTEK